MFPSPINGSNPPSTTRTTRGGGTKKARSAQSTTSAMSTPTVGSLHTAVRDTFTSLGWGSTKLKNVAKNYPNLMKLPATKKNMDRLVNLENKLSRQGKSKSRGDSLARAATPVRRSTVHCVGAHAAAGTNGHMRAAFGNGGRGYGEDIEAMLRDLNSNH